MGGIWVKTCTTTGCSPITISSDPVSIATISVRVGAPSDGEYFGPGIYKFRVRRYTASGSGSEVVTPVDINLTYIISTPTPSPTLTDVPSPTPTPTQTATKAVYNIEKSKDGSGVELTSVQIYVDGNYIHHEDDEILEFFADHECYSGVTCDLGTHTISLRKDGYSNWEDARYFTAGMNLEVVPVLIKQVTPSPTSSPTPMPTKTPTPAPTKTPTLSPPPQIFR